MTNNSAQELQQFIADNKLRRDDNLILFESGITICKTNTDYYSDILVVSLPQEMVLYIMEFCISSQPENEMYRTSDHLFTCLPNKKLEVTNPKTGDRIVISLVATKDQP
jgi:hypothetical protein